MNTDLRDKSIAESTRICLLSFNECLSRFALLPPEYQAAIEDQLGRLSIWASNIGVFADTRGSLDYRLREAEDVQRLIGSLLKTLNESIQQCLSHLLGFSRDRSCPGTISDIGSPESVMKDIAEQINLLHQLSNSIRKASSKKQNLRAANSFVIRDEEGDDYGPRFRNLFALAIIRQFFPTCPEGIQERLADTMLLRRKQTLYRYSRYSKSPFKRTSSTPPKVIPDAGQAQTAPVDTRHGSVAGISERKGPSNTIPARSVAESRAITATTLDMEQWRKVSAAPSVVSQSTAIQPTHIENLNFPSAPKGTVLQRLKTLKSQHLANLEDQLNLLPNYDLFKQHGGNPPLDLKDLEILRDKMQTSRVNMELAIERGEKHLYAGGMEVTCPYCCCTLSSAVVMNKKKWM